MLDLTRQEGSHHKKVLSIGVISSKPNESRRFDDSIYGERKENTLEKAFTFHLMLTKEPSEDKEATLVLRLASVHYMHAPNFLLDLSLCLTDFQEYLKKIRASLTVAAAELALGLINNNRIDLLGASLYSSNWSLNGVHESVSNLKFSFLYLF